MRNTNPALAEAYELDRRGQWAQAIERYQRLLAAEPRNSDALHLMGVAMGRMGRSQEALAAIAEAARLQPDNPAIHANLGIALRELGRDAEAVASFDRALALRSDFVAALNARGVAQLRLGRVEEAVKSLEDAARLAPGHASIHSDLGVALERMGRKEDALRHFECATALDPNSAEAHHNLGLMQATSGKLESALASLDRALSLAPRHGALHANRGNVLSDLGRISDAIASYEQALTLRPQDALTLRNRGRLLLQQQPQRALADFDAALALEPADFTANIHRGMALTVLERHAESLVSFDRALTLNPGSADALNNRGVALSHLSQPEAAVESFSRALESDAANLKTLTNMANTLTVLKRHSEALEHFDRALAIKPDDPDLAWGKGRLLLSLGQFKEGWSLYEHRLQLAHLRPLQRHASLPRWSGQEPIAGKTVLVHAEQGLGDTLQFCRYVPVVEARGAKVIFEVHPALKQLLRTLPMRGDIVAFEEPLAHFDLRTPLLSLPLLLGAEEEFMPIAVPYLRSDPSRAALWRDRLAQLAGLKVGIAWQGNVETEKQGGFMGRSFPLAAAAPLARSPQVTLISLQKGEGSEQRARVDFAHAVLELTDPWNIGPEEILDTAALITTLDLVITSDTATAHLAGALGIPVWVALPASADWRWLIERNDSPWYPTLRLFRQKGAGQWQEVFERVAQELSLLAAPRRPSA